MRQSNLQHSGQGCQAHSNELSRIRTIVRVNQVYSSESDVRLGEVLYYVLHALVHCVQLHLPRTVHDKVSPFWYFTELILEPADILEEELHGIHQSTIGPQTQLI